MYNLLAHQIAGTIHTALQSVEEVYVWLCSQIGSPIDQPWSTSVQVALAEGALLGDVAGPIQDIIRKEVADIGAFTERAARGELAVRVV